MRDTFLKKVNLTIKDNFKKVIFGVGEGAGFATTHFFDQSLEKVNDFGLKIQQKFC